MPNVLHLDGWWCVVLLACCSSSRCSGSESTPRCVNSHGVATVGGRHECRGPLNPSEAACARRHGRIKTDNCRHGGCGSQFGEDWALLPTLLNATRAHGSRGLFVEIGAYRGASLSNTLMYERCFNWTGVLIESNPLNFKALRVSKRDARLVHSAVCTGDGSSATTVPIAVEGFAVSGEIELMAPRFIRGHRGGTNNSNIAHVPCRSLQSILRLPVHTSLLTGSQQRLRPPRFDLLSLDVEGAEERDS